MTQSRTDVLARMLKATATSVWRVRALTTDHLLSTQRDVHLTDRSHTDEAELDDSWWKARLLSILRRVKRVNCLTSRQATCRLAVWLISIGSTRSLQRRLRHFISPEAEQLYLSMLTVLIHKETQRRSGRANMLLKALNRSELHNNGSLGTTNCRTENVLACYSGENVEEKPGVWWKTNWISDVTLPAHTMFGWSKPLASLCR